MGERRFRRGGGTAEECVVVEREELDAGVDGFGCYFGIAETACELEKNRSVKMREYGITSSL
jgi:hypothetical protein